MRVILGRRIPALSTGATALIAAVALLSCIAAVALAAGARWSVTGSMNIARAGAPAILLNDGDVLVAGGLNVGFGSRSTAELYDPSTGTWSFTGPMSTERASFVFQKLPSGEVLAAGGCYGGGDCGNVTATAELYDPATGTWRRTGSLPQPREDASSVIFASGPLAGQVLVFGGCCTGREDNLPFGSSLLYNPGTGRWRTTGSLIQARLGAAATVLPSGEVLASGGIAANGSYLANAELYDPATGKWSLTGSMTTPRVGDQQRLLPNGEVLAAGGCCGSGTGGGLTSAELYNPATGRWSHTGSMSAARWDFSSAVLPSGEFLAAGGCCTSSNEGLTSSELYNPTTGTWTPTASLNVGRYFAGSTLLSNGDFLIEGGFSVNPPIASTEIYTPGPGPNSPEADRVGRAAPRPTPPVASSLRGQS